MEKYTSLREELNNNNVIEDRYFILDDIVAGLKNIHQHNLVHGDIKANNILCKRKGRLTCYITDFGGTRELGQTRTVGSLEFLPFDIRNFSSRKIKLSFEDDIYNLGKLCIELFTGRSEKYIEGINYNNFDEKISANQLTNNFEGYDEPVKFRKQLKSLIHRCLNLLPKERPSLDEFYKFINSFNC